MRDNQPIIMQQNEMQQPTLKTGWNILAMALVARRCPEPTNPPSICVGSNNLKDKIFDLGDLESAGSPQTQRKKARMASQQTNHDHSINACHWTNNNMVWANLALPGELFEVICPSHSLEHLN